LKDNAHIAAGVGNNMAMLTGSKILVTGAAGFVGSNMVRRLLSENAEVYAIVRPGADLWRLENVVSRTHWLECDLLDFVKVGNLISRTRPEIIYHFAFPGGHASDPAGQMNMLSSGLLGTYALLNAACENEVKNFIQIGSSTEYGRSIQPFRETDRLEPETIRGVSKATATLLCQYFAREHDLRTIILRLFSNYGPWEQTNRLIPKACRAILQGNSLPLTPAGIMHDWIFIDDVVEACLAVLGREIPPGEIINIGSGEQHTNEEIVQILSDVAGRELKVETGAYEPHAHDTDYWVANIEHARTELGWQPKFSLQQGLKATFRFWQDWYAIHGDG
jgi:nucleoside-diphosphate-sugar epimerase